MVRSHRSGDESAPPAAGPLPRALGFDLSDDGWLRLVGIYRNPENLGSLGEYQLETELGRGGQGVVYRAVQPRTGRIVAIKRLTSIAGGSASFQSRFDREIRVSAALNHPNIVGVHGSDVVDGNVLLIMEYIPGVPFDRWVVSGSDAVSRRRDILDILPVFEKICAALTHAHQRGVIHRDLKPSNVLVDAGDEPHVLDFGLARLLSPFANDTTFRSHTTGFLGTPAYAAPEQFGEGDGEIDVRTDVYSLGCMLYQALTGKLPYGDTKSFGAMVRAIQDDDPPRPSGLCAGLDREVDVIVLRALAKRKDDRYPSVEALKEDLRRYRVGLPVIAHPPSACYQARKLIRRHRVAFLFSSTLLGLIITFAVVAGVLAVRERRARLDAEWNAYTASVAAASASLRAGDAASAQPQLRQAPQRLRNWEWRHFASLADGSEATIQTESVWTGLDANGDVSFPFVNRERFRIPWQVPASKVVAFLRRDHDRTESISPGLLRMLLVEERGDSIHNFALWNVGERQPAARFNIPELASRSMFSPDERTLVATTWEGVVYLIRIPESRFSNGGDASGPDRSISQINPFRLALFEGRISSCAFDSNSRRLAVAGAGGLIKIVDLDSFSLVQTVITGERAAWALAFSPDDSAIASGSMDKRVSVWNLADGTARWSAIAHRELVSDIVFSADGARLASASWDRTVCIWDAANGVVLDRLSGHAMPVETVAFLDGGDFLATMDRVSTIKKWRLSARLPSRASGRYQRVASLALPGKVTQSRWAAVLEAHDESWLHPRVSLLDLQKRARSVTLFADVTTKTDQSAPPIPRIAVSADGRRLAVGTSDGAVQIWDGTKLDEYLKTENASEADLRPALRLPYSGSRAYVTSGAWEWGEVTAGQASTVVSVSMNADGSELAICHLDGTLETYSLGRPTLRWTDRPVEPTIGRSCQFSPDGKQLATLDGTGRIRLLNAADGHLLLEKANPHRGSLRRALAFSRDGALLVPLIETNEIVVYRTSDLSVALRLSGHRGTVYGVAFSPDGTRLASAGADGLIKLWDTESGRQVATLHGHDLDATCVAFTGDGKTLVSGGLDNTIRFWDTSDSALVGREIGH